MAPECLSFQLRALGGEDTLEEACLASAASLRLPRLPLRHPTY